MFNLSNIYLETTNTLITQVVAESSRISARKYCSVELNTTLPNFFLMKPGFPPLILIRKYLPFTSKRWSMSPNIIHIYVPKYLIQIALYSRGIY